MDRNEKRISIEYIQGKTCLYASAVDRKPYLVIKKKFLTLRNILPVSNNEKKKFRV